MLKNYIFVICIVILTFIPDIQTKIFLDELESAPFSIVKETPNYEVRRYEQTKWVCNIETEKEFISRLMGTQYFSLFKYTAGENDRNERIPMTVPMTIKYTPKGDSEESELCSYIPSNLQNNPPRPVDKKLFIYNRPAMTAFVRTIKSYISTKAVWEDEALTLKTDLESARESNINFDTFISSYVLKNAILNTKYTLFQVQEIPKFHYLWPIECTCIFHGDIPANI